jgi:hypothetical protein
MFGLLSELMNPIYLLGNPLTWLVLGFQIWMLVDAVRREEWIWAACIIVFSVLSAVLYYVMVYRLHGPAGGGVSLRGFELPGAADRRRIRELEGRIHHLDKARDHSDLGDIYFSQGKLAKAEASYRAALERDGSDLDTLSHLGQCLLRMGRAAEAKPLLERVIGEDAKHDFGYTMMALAEAQTALGQKDDALASWRRVLAVNSYSRARVQYAELLLERGDRTGAGAELKEVLADDTHAPTFQRSRDKVWIRRARKLAASL